MLHGSVTRRPIFIWNSDAAPVFRFLVSLCYIRFSCLQMKSADSIPIKVSSRFGDYDVVCQQGLLRQTQKHIDALGPFSSVHILSSARVWKAIGRVVRGGFAAKQMPQVHLLNDAETAKTLATVEKTTR